MEYEYTNRLIHSEVIITDKSSLTEKELVGFYDLMANTKDEVIEYIRKLMKLEPYVYELDLPLGKIRDTGLTISDEELVKLPFGTFSLNLWQKLTEDKENPVYKLLFYLDFSLTYLRSVLVVNRKGVITLDTLNERGIIDVYSLHSYNGVYDGIDEYWR